MKKTGTPYANWKDDGSYDAIVIGSGIGGLAAAALLAKHGNKRVLVLERHTKAGGFTHAFSRKDWDWDVGVHYIGQVHHEGSMLRRLFDEVGDGSLQWEPMGEVYDTVVIGGQRWEYVSGREAWRARMHSYFPDETTAIDRYLEQVREAIGGARTFFAEKALPGPAAAGRRTVDAAEIPPPFSTNPGRGPRWGHRQPDPEGGARRPVRRPRPSALAGQLCHPRHDLQPLPRRRRLSNRRRLEDCRVGGTRHRGRGRRHRRLRRRGVGCDRGRSRGGRAHGRRPKIRAPLVVSDAGVPNTVFRLLPEGTPGRESLEGDASTDLTVGLTHLPLCGSRWHR